MPYLAMEWFPAPNMKQRMLQGHRRIAYHLVPKIVEQAAEALDYFKSRVGSIATSSPTISSSTTMAT